MKQGVKRGNPTSFAASEEHMEALKEIRSCDPIFPPTNSEVVGVAILHLRDSLRRGETTLKAIYQTYVAPNTRAISRN